MSNLINNNLSTSGIFRGKLLKDGADIRVYVPGIHSNSMSNNLKVYPVIQWCCYNIESAQIENMKGPAFIMFENGDVNKPVCVSYSVIGGSGSGNGSSGGNTVYADAVSNNINNNDGGGSSNESSDESPIPFDGTFKWPSYTTHVTSPYGYRVHPVTGVTRFHTGVDIGSSYGTDVWASASGTVSKASNTGDGYGNCVIITHSDGFSTMYAHNSSLCVSVGQSVNKGDVIAKCGSTGMSTGPHIHFEIRVNGAHTNPMNYF